MVKKAASLLAELNLELEAATKSLPLTHQSTDIVPGEGSAEAEVMFIGEAPGYHETVQRKPFVGRSGQLLRKTLEEIALPAQKYYISNIVKARPPDNRDPFPAEIAAYKPFLDREIQILQPELVVTLGRYSMAKFLPEVRISQVHGRLHKLRWENKTIYVLPMYHPAAGLRSTQVKLNFIEDMKKIPKVLEWIQDQQQIAEEADLIKAALS